MVVTDRKLRLGENTPQRLQRPAWTSENSTGNFQAHKSRHGKYLEKGFYIFTNGLYKKSKKSGANMVVERRVRKHG